MQEFNQHIILQMLRNIPESVILLINRQQRIILGGGAEMGDLGLTPGEINGKPLPEVLSKNIHTSLDSLVEQVFQNTPVSHEMKFGKSYYYIQAIPILGYDTSTVDACMIIFQNVTEERINAQVLKTAKLKAERSNRSKTKFLADISHEIRTPLNSVIGFSEQLAKTNLDKKQEGFLSAIRKSSDHLMSILNETITLSRVESEEFQIEKEVFMLKDVMDAVENMEKIKADKKGLKLNIIISRRLGRPVYGDPVCLKQILLNVVNNAVKFTTSGSINVSAEIEEEQGKDIIVRFKVIDTGIGIDKSKHREIFDEFVQENHSNAYKSKGSGLGLSITKKLVELQKGEITVESNRGKGSEFIIKLPYEIAEKEDRFRFRQQRINPDTLKGKKFMLADDDEMNRMLAETIFKEWGVDYDLASDGIEAVGFAENCEYDVILLDIRMPGMGGEEAAQNIRSLYSGRESRYTVLAVTANVTERDLKSYLEKGIDGYLLKPFRESDLYNLIIRHLLIDVINEPGIVGMGQQRHGKKAMHSSQDYDLTTLQEMTSDIAFFNNMIDTFISNASQNIVLMESYLENKDWEKLGEVAHKMIPSFRHLNAVRLADLLVKMEELTLREKKYQDVPSMVEQLQRGIFKLIEQLEKEIKKYPEK